MDKRLIGSVKRHEGFRATVYQDHLGNPTIGYGTRVGEIVVDRDTAEGWLLDELVEKEERLAGVVGFLGMDDVRQAVVLEMAYQMGVGGVLKFRRMWAAIRRRGWSTAADEMLDSRWAMEQTPRRAELLALAMGTGEWGDGA